MFRRGRAGISNLCILLLWLATLAASPAVLAATLRWEVVNRFPLLSDDAFQRLQLAVTSATSNPADGRPASTIESSIVQVDLRRQVGHLSGLAWDARAERYDEKRLFAPTAKVRLTSVEAQGLCSWTLRNKTGHAEAIRQEACATPVDLEATIDVPYEVELTVDGRALPPEPLRVQSRLIVALGDSFASGEGNPDYPAVLDQRDYSPRHDWAIDRETPIAGQIVRESAQWMNDSCHRSLLAWPSLVALQQAITRQDTVVRFASFACSGAKVVAGFLFRQENPPGDLSDIDPTFSRSEVTRVRHSQLEALVDLVCDDQQTLGAKSISVKEISEYIRAYNGQRRSNKKTVPVCPNPRPVDDLFVLFGGNDTGFSSVIAWLLDPQDLKWRNMLLGMIINSQLRSTFQPLSARDAAIRVIALKPLYAVMDDALREAGISAARITMLQYPDPTESSHPSRLAEELAACRARTRDGNRPLQSLVADILRRSNHNLKHDNALFGVNRERYQSLRSSYIEALKQGQEKFRPDGWHLVDSQPAFRGRSFCAGSLECERIGEGCAKGDQVRWDYPAQMPLQVPVKDGSKGFTCEPQQSQVGGPPRVHSCTPAMHKLEDFQAYDPGRQRGLLYANDALLTSARLESGEKGGRVRLDWIAGLAHPSATVHAAIATVVRDSQSAVRGQLQR